MPEMPRSAGDAVRGWAVLVERISGTISLQASLIASATNRRSFLGPSEKFTAGGTPRNALLENALYMEGVSLDVRPEENAQANDLRGSRMGGAIFFVVALVACMAAALFVHLSREPCPSCGRRGTVRWVHARRDGGPDRRYSTNFRLCGCGWSEGQEQLEAVVAQRLADAHQLARAAEELRERRQRSHEAERRRRAEAVEAEQRMVELEAEERAIIWLLKHIAKADRRNAEGEAQELQRQIDRLFPAERRDTVARWAAELRVDSTDDLHRAIDRLRDLPLVGRAEIYAALETMSVADGKATKSETTRLARIRSALGLDELV
ncbi:MAG: TerB family tellurite resistance protein [Sandaracinaceae bacterium]